jgi:hypothetical protein
MPTGVCNVPISLVAAALASNSATVRRVVSWLAAVSARKADVAMVRDALMAAASAAICRRVAAMVQKPSSTTRPMMAMMGSRKAAVMMAMLPRRSAGTPQRRWRGRGRRGRGPVMSCMVLAPCWMGRAWKHRQRIQPGRAGFPSRPVRTDRPARPFHLFWSCSVTAFLSRGCCVLTGWHTNERAARFSDAGPTLLESRLGHAHREWTAGDAGRLGGADAAVPLARA